jgi:hypothetical protein
MEFFNYLLRHKCYGILNREIGTCFLNHPHNLDFWKIAAYNEFENGFNTLAARNIFQKCLRLNRRSLEANVEYFVFELRFVQKIMQRRNMLMRKEKKMYFVENVDNVENEEEKEEIKPEPVSDDIMLLKVPEVIWLKACENLKDSYKSNKTNLAFLSKLMRYGKELNYKRLKGLIIDKILEEDKSIDTMCEIIKAKLEKYEKKVDKAIIKFTKLITEHTNSRNTILFYLITTVDNEPNRVISAVLKHIDTNELLANYQFPQNLALLKCLFDNFTYVSSDFDIEALIDKIITKLLNDLSIMNLDKSIVDQYFELYWKNIFNESNKFDHIYEYVKNKNVNSPIFSHTMIKNLCTMIKNEIGIYPDKLCDYIEKIEHLISAQNFKDISLVKDIWKYLLNIVIEYKLISLPSDLSYIKLELDKEFIEPVKSLAKKLSKFLINFPATLNELKVNFF